MLATLEGSPLTSASAPSPTPPKKFLSPSELSSLPGQTVLRAERKGKLIRLVLSGGSFLYIHQMMTGRVSTPSRVVALESLSSGEYPPPHTHLVLKTATAECAWSDSRRFGQCFLAPGGGPWDALAPDALELGRPAVLERAAAALAGQAKGAKELLLDQKRVCAGVGNWIADEIMYRCEMHVRTP
jgi:formamidopyrimidine-DNA glycosylase